MAIRPINLTDIVSYGAEPCYPLAMEPWRCNDPMFDIERYLEDRGDARIRSWADWVANARFREDASRAGAENWLALKNHHAPGKADQVARSLIARLALQRVMSENGIDAFVHPENTVPTPKIQGPNVGARSASKASRPSCKFRAWWSRPARRTSSTSRGTR